MVAPSVGGVSAVKRGVIFVLTTLAGGVTTGLLVLAVAVLTQISPPLQAASHFAGVALALYVAVASQKVIPEVVPGSSWMIPRWWAVYGWQRYTSLFGYCLGLGWRTKLTSNAFGLIVVASLFVTEPIVSLLPFAVFALVRAVPIALFGVCGNGWQGTVSIAQAEQCNIVLRGLAESRLVRYAHLPLAIAVAVALIYYH